MWAGVRFPVQIKIEILIMPLTGIISIKEYSFIITVIALDLEIKR
jgi:hypothetical protein